MASDPDDNPFARNSAWPQMPQAPFKVGPLPKAGAQPAPVAEPPPRTITPAFVRPVSPPAFTGVTGGGITPVATAPRPVQPPQPAAPVARVEPVVAPTPSPAAPPPMAQAEPEPPPQTYVEIAPVLVQPLGSTARKAARKSPVPAIVATGVGLAAILGIAYALNRGQEAVLKAAPPPAAAPAAVVPATPVPTQPQATARQPVAPAPKAEVASTPSSPARAATPVRKAAPKAAAPTVAASPPVLALPPAPVTAPPIVTPAPLPSYTAPAAPDPNAPMTTRRPE